MGEAHAVRDAVARLAPEHRELVELVHWEGFSIADAGAVLGLNASTARSQYSAARQKLRLALRDESPEPDGSVGSSVGASATGKVNHFSAATEPFSVLLLDHFPQTAPKVCGPSKRWSGNISARSSCPVIAHVVANIGWAWTTPVTSTARQKLRQALRAESPEPDGSVGSSVGASAAG